MFPIRSSLCWLVALVLVAASSARAVTLPEDSTPHQWHSFNTQDNAFLGMTEDAWTNDQPGALYAEWGGFVPVRAGTWTFTRPTVAQGASTSVVLAETSGTGWLTGSGIIYGLAYGQGPGPPLIFDLVVTDAGTTAAAPGATRTVVMRSGTKGVLPNLNATLDGVAATGIATFRVDGSIDMPTGVGGAIEANATSDAEWLWKWTGVPIRSQYRFDFSASVGHMSLDNLAVYFSPPKTASSSTGATARRHAAVPVNALAHLLGEEAAAADLLAGLPGTWPASASTEAPTAPAGPLSVAALTLLVARVGRRCKR